MITIAEIQAYETLSLYELIEERTRLAVEIEDDTVPFDVRWELYDYMCVVCDLIEKRMNENDE